MGRFYRDRYLSSKSSGIRRALNGSGLTDSASRPFVSPTQCSEDSWKGRGAVGRTRLGQLVAQRRQLSHICDPALDVEPVLPGISSMNLPASAPKESSPLAP